MAALAHKDASLLQLSQSRILAAGPLTIQPRTLSNRFARTPPTATWAVLRATELTIFVDESKCEVSLILDLTLYESIVMDGKIDIKLLPRCSRSSGTVDTVAGANKPGFAERLLQRTRRSKSISAKTAVLSSP